MYLLGLYFLRLFFFILKSLRCHSVLFYCSLLIKIVLFLWYMLYLCYDSYAHIDTRDLYLCYDSYAHIDTRDFCLVFMLLQAASERKKNYNNKNDKQTNKQIMTTVDRGGRAKFPLTNVLNKNRRGSSDIYRLTFSTNFLDSSSLIEWKNWKGRKTKKEVQSSFITKAAFVFAKWTPFCFLPTIFVGFVGKKR